MGFGSRRRREYTWEQHWFHGVTSTRCRRRDRKSVCHIAGMGIAVGGEGTHGSSLALETS
eukprot:11741671-Heterocapsa_arctica.AAC.1